MNRESADQLIRCVKECWWRLMIFFAVELFFVALVTYGWPQGDWSLGWGAIGALGTLLTGGAASWIAYLQKKKDDSNYYLKAQINILNIESTVGDIKEKINQVFGFSNFERLVYERDIDSLIEVINSCKGVFKRSCDISLFVYGNEGLSDQDVELINDVNNKIKFLKKGVENKLINLTDDGYIYLFFDSLIYFYDRAFDVLEGIEKMKFLRDGRRVYKSQISDYKAMIIDIEKVNADWKSRLQEYVSKARD